MSISLGLRPYGGIAFLDSIKYYETTDLPRVVALWRDCYLKQWITLEKTVMDIPLSLIGPTVHALVQPNDSGKLLSYDPILRPILGNTVPAVFAWDQGSPILTALGPGLLLYHFICKTGMKSTDAIQHILHSPLESEQKLHHYLALVTEGGKHFRKHFALKCLSSIYVHIPCLWLMLPRQHTRPWHSLMRISLLHLYLNGTGTWESSSQRLRGMHHFSIACNCKNWGIIYWYDGTQPSYMNYYLALPALDSLSVQSLLNVCCCSKCLESGPTG